MAAQKRSGTLPAISSPLDNEPKRDRIQLRDNKKTAPLRRRFFIQTDRSI
jgi:hypothetical protein